MTITVQQGTLSQTTAAMLATGYCEGDTLPDAIATLLEPEDFRGTARQTTLLYPRGALAARRLLLAGLGKRDTLTADTLRDMAARAVAQARALKVADLTIALPTIDSIPTALAAQALAEGALLGNEPTTTYKSKPTPEEAHILASITLLVENDIDAAQQGATLGRTIAMGVLFARQLANAPGNIATPAFLAEQALQFDISPRISVKVLQGDDLAGFGGLLAVGQGSAHPPRFIILEYGTPSEQHPTICLVGKGITFDSGGISIKPAAKMDEMKMDMSGAAAVIGTFRALGNLDLPLHVVGLISAAENMPGSNAYRPGDIITTLSGKTIEVLNTDAEGRIVLADALHYALHYQPTAIIDLATLTGAIAVALGPHAIGLFSNNQPLADRVLRAGDTSAERAWQLPLWADYHDMIKSSIADLSNTGPGRDAGSITAAAFLAAFVETTPWVHLDIAATAWKDNATRAYEPKGATGVGVRLLVQVLRDWIND